MLLSILSWHAFHSKAFSVRKSDVLIYTVACNLPITLWVTLLHWLELGTIKFSSIPEILWLKPKALEVLWALFSMWCVTVGSLLAQGELGLNFRVLGSACYGNLPDISCSSLSSGVWLASASRWGRNQRAFPEAGAAGLPGPTAPGPVGPEPRVQRGSATTPSKSSQKRFRPSMSSGRLG